MRFLSILGLVVAILTLGAVERAAHAYADSTQAKTEASSTQAVDGIGSPRAAHPGHVPAHRPLPSGDVNSMLCKILCAVAVAQPPLTAPSGVRDWLQSRERLAAVEDVEADEAAPGLHPPPPR